MQKVNSRQIKRLKTLIKEFMVDRSNNNKTFEELVKIFDGCYQGFDPDPSNDLRICCYVEDMKKGNWKDNIVITIQNGEVIDGIHRGIAYLKCVNDGIDENNLPKVFIAK